MCTLSPYVQSTPVWWWLMLLSSVLYLPPFSLLCHLYSADPTVFTVVQSSEWLSTNTSYPQYNSFTHTSLQYRARSVCYSDLATSRTASDPPFTYYCADGGASTLNDYYLSTAPPSDTNYSWLHAALFTGAVQTVVESLAVLLMGLALWCQWDGTLSLKRDWQFLFYLSLWLLLGTATAVCSSLLLHNLNTAYHTVHLLAIPDLSPDFALLHTTETRWRQSTPIGEVTAVIAFTWAAWLSQALCCWWLGWMLMKKTVAAQEGTTAIQVDGGGGGEGNGGGQGYQA